MEQREFIKLMESKGSQDKETIGMLQDFVSNFPYCQTGQMLLAKCLHDQHNILFDQQMKTAAIYSADRKILYSLIHHQAENRTEEDVPVFKEEPIFPFRSVIFQDVEESIPESEEVENTAERERSVFAEAAFKENIFQEKIPDPSINIADRETEESFSSPGDGAMYFDAEETETTDEMLPESEEQKIIDPHEVIRKRLTEILGKNDYTDFKKDYTDKTPSEKTVEENQIREKISLPLPETKADEEEIIAGQVEKVRDVIDKIGLEHALEETILHSIEKLPVIDDKNAPEEIPGHVKNASQSNQEIPVSETHLFLDWLKIKSHPDFGVIEEVQADENPADEIAEPGDSVPPAISKEDLISQFIATEPRIVPSKVEFYSPVNQAKKSITEHDDMISETLARIYFNQGNLLKARSGYQKLSLLHPEKSSYFAALIQEIDNLINKQE
jgi:hypothetical protein